MKTEKHTLPAHWASYLINGDSSGMYEEDIARCNNDTKDLGICVDVSENTFFGRYAGLGTEVAEYTFAPVIATSGKNQPEQFQHIQS